MTTSWTKIAENTSSWTGIPKPQGTTTTTTVVGSPIGLLLALTYSITSSFTSDPWTKVPENTSSWTKIAKAT